MPLLSCSELLLGMFTRALVPLNDNAPPYLPDAVQVAFEIVPLLPFPDESWSTVPAPSLNEYAATRLPVAARPLAMTPVAATSPLAAAANAMTLAMRDDILGLSFERPHAALGVSTPLAATLRRCSVAVVQEQRRPQRAGAPVSRPESVVASTSEYRLRRTDPGA